MEEEASSAEQSQPPCALCHMFWTCEERMFLKDRIQKGAPCFYQNITVGISKTINQMGIEEDLKTNEQWFEKFLHNCSPTNWQYQYVGGYDRSTGLDGDW